MKKLLIFLAALAGALAAPAWAGPADALGAGLSFCGEAVPLGDDDVYRAVDQNLVLLSEAQSRVWLSLRRAGRFLPAVEAGLKRAGLPGDLKYIPYAITGFDPLYRGGGRGLWRLGEAEARALGLRVDSAVDERLDPVAATAAACRRLAALKSAYGSWTAAMAAHLIGEAAMQKAVAEAGGERDYYKLYLPDGLDTLPAMVLAGKALFSDPAAFGYRAAQARPWPPLSGRRAVTAAPAPLRDLAAQYTADYKHFRDLNPHLTGDMVPAGVGVNLP